jgi:hypothetical protein
MLRIILLGAAAVALALFADVYASDPNLTQGVSPYAALAPFYAPPPVEGRAAYVNRSAPSAMQGANDVSKVKVDRAAP